MAICITTIEQLHKKLFLAYQLQFSSLYTYAYELVEIITNTTLVNSFNQPDP